MKEFIRIRQDGTMEFCYIVDVKKERGCPLSVYYGHSIPGHENKTASAVMTYDYFCKLVKSGDIITNMEVA